MVDRVLLFRALHAHIVGFYVLCFVGKVYPWPRISLLSLREAVWDEPAQYISMRAPETTRGSLGSHYRDSQLKDETGS